MTPTPFARAHYNGKPYPNGKGPDVDAWQVLSGLRGFKRVGNGCQACCPGHKDDSPSLSLLRTSDGTILLHCHAGCALEDILSATHLQKRDLFPPTPQHFSELGEITALYDYHSETGTFLHQTVRFEKKVDGKRAKTFRQRRPDGKDGWIWNLQTIQPVLYRLPALFASDPSAIVYLPEGEKDADKLIGLGLIATTNPMGAGKWNPSYSAALRGRHVVMLPDNDDAGRAHVQKVVPSLKGEAASVSVLELPGLPEGEDVSWWLDNGGTLEELRQLTDQAMQTTDIPEGKVEKEEVDEVPRKTQATRLIELVTASGCMLFHTSEGDAYATFTIGGHEETAQLKTKSFRRWLGRLYYEVTSSTAGSQAVQDALSVLEARALYDGEKHPVFVRIARHEGDVYIDMGNEGWQVIQVTSEGWQVLDNSPVKFRRTKGMLPLPDPERGGSVNDLKPFINLSNPNDWALLSAYLVAAFRPEGPYPILALGGEQGSAKSTTARLIRSLVDPSSTPLRIEPRNAQDLMIAATNAWLPTFDNLSHIATWLSDGLCRLSTGGGFATRELYSDTEETIFEAQRPVMLTSIEDVATRGDLLDRSIILSLAPIADENRRPERALWGEFEQVRPRILGALLTAVSAALHNLPTTKLERLPRMADFALWATAAEQALGLSQGEFMGAYLENRADANNLALDAELVAGRLREFMDKVEGGKWEGTASELLEGLNTFAGYIDSKKVPEGWPKRADKLSNQLRRIAPNLRQLDIDIQFERSGKRGRFIKIRAGKQTSVTSVTSVIPTPKESKISDATHQKGDATSAKSDARFRVSDATSGTSDASDASLHSYSYEDEPLEFGGIECVQASGGLCMICSEPCEYARRHTNWRLPVQGGKA